MYVTIPKLCDSIELSGLMMKHCNYKPLNLEQGYAIMQWHNSAVFNIILCSYGI